MAKNWLKVMEVKEVDSNQAILRMHYHVEHEQTLTELSSSSVSQLKSQIEKRVRTLEECGTPTPELLPFL